MAARMSGRPDEDAIGDAIMSTSEINAQPPATANQSSGSMLQAEPSYQSSSHISQQDVEGLGRGPVIVQALQAYLGVHYASLENDLAGLPPSPHLSPEIQSHLPQMSASASAQAPGNVGPTSTQSPISVSPRKRSRVMIEDIPDHRGCGREPGQCKAVKTRANADANGKVHKTRTQGESEYAKKQARKARVEQLRNRHDGCAKSAHERRNENQVRILIDKKLDARLEKFTDQEPSAKYEVMNLFQESILCGHLTKIECKSPLPVSDHETVRRMFDCAEGQNEVTTSGIEKFPQTFVAPERHNAITVDLDSGPHPATQTSSVTEPTQDMDGIQEHDVASSQDIALVSPFQEGAPMEDLQIAPSFPNVSTLASPRTPDSTFSDIGNGYSTEDTEMSGDEFQVSFGSGSFKATSNAPTTTVVPAMKIPQTFHVVPTVYDPKMVDVPGAQMGLLSTASALVGDATMDDVPNRVSVVEPARSSDTCMQEAQATSEQPGVIPSVETPLDTQLSAPVNSPLQTADPLTVDATDRSTSSQGLVQTSNIQPQSANIAAAAPTRGVKRPAEDAAQVVTAYQGKKRKTASPRKTPQAPTSTPPVFVEFPSFAASEVSYTTEQVFNSMKTSAEMAVKKFMAESDEGYHSHVRMLMINFTTAHPKLADQYKNDILVLINEKYSVHHGVVTESHMWEQKQEFPDVVQQHFECLQVTAVETVKNKDGLVDTDEGYQEALRSRIKSAIANSTASDQLKNDFQFLLYKEYPLRFEGATDMTTYSQIHQTQPEPPNVYEDPLGHAEWVLEWRPLLIPDVHKPLVKMLVSEAARIDPGSPWLEAMGTPSHLVGSLQDGLLMLHPNYKLRGQAALSEGHLCWEYRNLHPRTRLELNDEILDIAKYNPEEYGRVLQCAFDMDLHPADCFRDEHESGLASEAYDEAMDFVPALDNVRLDDFFAKTYCGATLTQKQVGSLPLDVSGDALDLVDRLKHLGSLDILQEATEQFFARGDFAERKNIFRQALRRAGLCTDIGNYAFRDFQAWLNRIELGPTVSESDKEAGADHAMKDDMNDTEKAKAKAEADERAEAEAQIVIELETALQEILKLRYPRTQKFGAAQALRPPLRETTQQQKQEPAIRKGDAPKSSKGAIWRR